MLLIHSSLLRSCFFCDLYLQYIALDNRYFFFVASFGPMSAKLNSSDTMISNLSGDRKIQVNNFQSAHFLPYY